MNPRYKNMEPSLRLQYSRDVFDMDTPPDLYIEVPCGSCQACEKRRMFDYRVRLMYELDVYPNSAFITLTFNDEYIKLFADNPNMAVRRFLDRMRKTFGKQIRHWIVSEYGTLNGRIHYHGFLFNVPDNFDTKLLQNLWKYGFVWLGYANERSAKYITKYVTKSASAGKKAPRIICSKGVGLSYLTPESVHFHIGDFGNLRPYLQVGGCKYPLPRYYYSKVFTDDLKVEMILDRFYNPPEKFYVAGKEYDNELDFILARRRLFERNCKLGLSVDKNKQNGKHSNS